MAFRQKDDSLVEEAVKKAAESNPRKLQQVGLNYDRAHLKASQSKPNQETAKNETSIPIRESKPPEQITKVSVVVKQATVPPTEGSAAAEGAVAGTAQPETTKEDEAKREEPSGSTAVASGSAGQDKQQPDVNAGPEGEGEKHPEPVEEKPKAEEEDDEDKPAGPWNAVCVIGLRVYSKDANLGLRLEES